MLRTALGPAIARFLEDARVVEATLAKSNSWSSRAEMVWPLPIKLRPILQRHQVSPRQPRTVQNVWCCG